MAQQGNKRWGRPVRGVPARLRTLDEYQAVAPRSGRAGPTQL